MTRGRTAWVMAALLGCSAAVATAGRTNEPRPLVSVPVFVTDARGRTIANLEAPDFEIRQSGAPQKIAGAVYRGGSPRRVAFFLDEYHVAAGTPTDRARAALARFVERHLQPDDDVAVMKPLDPRDYQVSFSADEWARLEATFPQGVCDWSQPGVKQRRLEDSWLAYPKPGHSVRLDRPSQPEDREGR